MECIDYARTKEDLQIICYKYYLIIYSYNAMYINAREKELNLGYFRLFISLLMLTAVWQLAAFKVHRFFKDNR